jgi:predicted membrane metal-binding protein
MIQDILRFVLVAVGLIASVDPSMSGSALTAALLALTALTLALLATALYAATRGSTPHPTRRIELTAPLAQSDPDAAGHVRRRGPGQVTAAA